MKIINIVQNFFLASTLVILALLPLWSAFGNMSPVIQSIWYFISFLAVTLVMLIRPLADIFINQKWLRKLVVLRKGVGLLSASIVIAFVIGKLVIPDSSYLALMFTKQYWSFRNYTIFAHLGDITGFILLITSNNLSMVLMKKNWKRVQKLAYVYFYAGGIYEAGALGSKFAIISMIVVTIAVCIAFLFNRRRQNSHQQTAKYITINNLNAGNK